MVDSRNHLAVLKTPISYFQDANERIQNSQIVYCQKPNDNTIKAFGVHVIDFNTSSNLQQNTLPNLVIASRGTSIADSCEQVFVVEFTTFDSFFFSPTTKIAQWE